ncbi:MAG: redoxin family protein [Verrucomicrobiota bacterium]
MKRPLFPNRALRLACAALVIVSQSGTAQNAAAPAAEKAPATIATRHQKITDAYSAATRAAKDAATRQKALKERDAALEQLLADAEAAGFASLAFDDHRVLATAASGLRKYEDAARHAQGAIEKGKDQSLENVYFTLTSSLLNLNKPAEAEKWHQEGIQRYPTYSSLRSQQYSLYAAMSRAGNTDAAARHITDYVEYQKSLVLRAPSSGRYFHRFVDNMIDALKKAGQTSLALQKVEELADAFKSADHASVRGEMVTRQLKLLTELDKSAEADQLLASNLKSAEDALAADEKNTAAILRLASMLRARAELTKDDTQAAEFHARHLAFLREQIAKIPNASLITAYADAALNRLTALQRADKFAEAETLAQETVKSLDALPDTDRAVKTAATQAKSSLQSAVKRAEADKSRNQLVGRPAFPLGIDTWVNGSPIAEKDLKGKVVLLDFWAVWCGPCIATFPHLRHWQDEFANKGLVILGITRHYSYDWDAQAKRPKRIDGLTPQKEEAAMVEFAKHHQLKHRFGVAPKDNTLYKDYGVTGIPQAVLIDRQGKVRMIRVGSGEQNAKDLEALLKSLLAEPAT